MKYLAIALALSLSACATLGHPGASPCVTSITRATDLPSVRAALEAMGVEKGLAAKTAEALMTSRLTPGQVCAAMKR